MKTRDRRGVLIAIVFTSLVTIVFFTSKSNTHSPAEINQKSEVYLYPGFLIKENGRLFWFSKEPEFENSWKKENCVEVTNCIFDPWPYTSGGKEFLMEIKN